VRRSTRLALLAAVAGLVVPVAGQTSVSAIDQDLVVPTTSGAPGTEVVVSSASCVPDDDGTTFQYLWVRLVSGTAPAQVLAGSATSFGDEEAAAMIVPDWVDPDAPATIEATCVSVGFDFDADAPEPVLDLQPYDPVAFDILPSADAPVQQRTYSRTSMLAGQGFSVAGSGCFVEDPEYAYVDVVPGSDLSFSTLSPVGISGDGDMDGDAFEAFATFVNGGITISSDQYGIVEIDEVGTDLPAGTYSSVSYCASEDGATLVYEPQLLEITGNAPFDAIDLTVPADSRAATLAGQSCTAGDVEGYFWGEDTATDFEELARTAPDGPVSPAGIAGGRGAVDPTFLSAAGAAEGPGGRDRVIDEAGTDLVITPAADGTWSVTDEVDFDRGFVGSFTACGDPLADGFVYDAQAAAVDVAVVEPTTPPTVPPTTPAPAPADAVAGSPTYAG